MGFRFRKSVKILPWVRVNISKSGLSLSVGPQGANINISERGIRKTLGVPGTGLYYTTMGGFGLGGGEDKSPEQQVIKSVVKEAPLSEDEQGFIEGCQALAEDKPEIALDHFKNSPLADAVFMAGLTAIQLQHMDEATLYLKQAYEHKSDLGTLFAKHDLAAVCSLPITEEITAQVTPSEQGVLLAWAEVYQAQGKMSEAIETLQHLQNLLPNDPVVKLSLAELLLDQASPAQTVIDLIGMVENETYIDTALLLYKAIALQKLGLMEAATDNLATALKRKKDRPQELLLAVQYQRALLYEQIGQAKLARKDLESVYAIDPHFEDVGQRLGLQ